MFSLFFSMNVTANSEVQVNESSADHNTRGHKFAVLGQGQVEVTFKAKGNLELTPLTKGGRRTCLHNDLSNGSSSSLHLPSHLSPSPTLLSPSPLLTHAPSVLSRKEMKRKYESQFI